MPNKVKYFNRGEFACKCGCGLNKVQDSLLERLDVAREIAGVPFVIKSGYRCPQHNAAVGGVANSAHTRGLAADIACTAATKNIIVKGLIKAGFKRIGLGGNFVHADIDPTLGNAIWTYDKK